MALAGKTSAILGTFLFAAGMFAACAGDGVDDTDSPKGGSGGSTNSGTGGKSSGSGGSSSGSGGSSSGSGGSSSGSGGSSSGTGGSSSGSGGSTSSTGGITTVGGYHSSGGLKGYFWTSSDMVAPGTGTSTISPANFETTPKICVSGVAAKVPSETAYGTHWGTLVGWNIDQADKPPNMPAKKALTGSITVGFAGTTIPGTVRVKVAVGTTDYCATIMAGSPQTIPVSSLKKECWLTGGAAYAGEPVEAIAIQVVTNTTSTSPFDFCVTDMSVTP